MGREVPTLCSLRRSISIPLSVSAAARCVPGAVWHERVQRGYAGPSQRFKHPTLRAGAVALSAAMLVF